jgi:hypothetical protein
LVLFRVSGNHYASRMGLASDLTRKISAKHPVGQLTTRGFRG